MSGNKIIAAPSLVRIRKLTSWNIFHRHISCYSHHDNSENVHSKVFWHVLQSHTCHTGIAWTFWTHEHLSYVVLNCFWKTSVHILCKQLCHDALSNDVSVNFSDCQRICHTWHICAHFCHTCCDILQCDFSVLLALKTCHCNTYKQIHKSVFVSWLFWQFWEVGLLHQNLIQVLRLDWSWGHL